MNAEPDAPLSEQLQMQNMMTTDLIPARRLSERRDLAHRRELLARIEHAFPWGESSAPRLRVIEGGRDDRAVVRLTLLVGAVLHDDGGSVA